MTSVEYAAVPTDRLKNYTQMRMLVVLSILPLCIALVVLGILVIVFLGPDGEPASGSGGRRGPAPGACSSKVAALGDQPFDSGASPDLMVPFERVDCMMEDTCNWRYIGGGDQQERLRTDSHPALVGYSDAQPRTLCDAFSHCAFISGHIPLVGGGGGGGHDRPAALTQQEMADMMAELAFDRVWMGARRFGDQYLDRDGGVVLLDRVNASTLEDGLCVVLDAGTELLSAPCDSLAFTICHIL